MIYKRSKISFFTRQINFEDEEDKDWSKYIHNDFVVRMYKRRRVDKKRFL